MGQKKLIRFAEIATYDHVLQYPENTAGKWHERFNNNHPIVLELACGKGEYSIGLASLYPNKNLIGVDVKGNRIWVGAKKSLQAGMKNVAFIRSQIGMINNYFAAGEVDEIWIPFPDPQLRISKSNRRLTHPKFLRKYQQILKPGGYINLKTDSPVLYQFTKLVIKRYGLTLLEDSDDISRDLKQNEALLIKTHYESLDIAKSKKVHYLKIALAGFIDPTMDESLSTMVREIETALTERLKDEKETDRR